MREFVAYLNSIGYISMYKSSIILLFSALLLMYNLPQKMSVFGQLIELLTGNVMLHLRESKELSNRM